MNGPARMLRDRMAQTAAMRQYARAHDRFSEQEQTLAHLGSTIAAEGARFHARIATRAWLAERDDPEPRP